MKIGAAFQEPDATVPAENTVVVANGADFFGFGETAHGLFDEGQKDVRGIADEKLGLGAALVKQTRVVETLVGIAQALEEGEHLWIAIGGSAEKLIGDGETEHAECELVVGNKGKNVATDGFGFFRLVNVAIEFGFGDGLGDAGFGNGFELVCHGTSSCNCESGESFLLAAKLSKQHG